MVIKVILTVIVITILGYLFGFVFYFHAMNKTTVGDFIVDTSDPEKDIFRLVINPDFEDKIEKLSRVSFQVNRIEDSNEKHSL